MKLRLQLSLLGIVLVTFVALGDNAMSQHRTLTGKEALGDWTTDAPGVRRKITIDDLATPYETPSATNRPRIVERPQGAWPKAPEALKSLSLPPSLKSHGS